MCQLLLVSTLRPSSMMGVATAWLQHDLSVSLECDATPEDVLFDRNPSNRALDDLCSIQALAMKKEALRFGQPGDRDRTAGAEAL
jgi:hypothetical protein